MGNGLGNTAERWGLVAQLLHWIIALMILAMVGLGLYMNSLPLGPLQFQLYALHKAIGMVILALVVVRIAWRITHRTPALPSTLKPWERVVASATHILLYGLLLAMPVSGYIINSASGFPMTLFGIVTVPNIIPASGALQDAAESVHGWLSRLLVAFVILHIGAALKHHFILKDDVLLRMTPFRRR